MQVAQEKEHLLQEVIQNFKNLRKSMEISHTQVKIERDNLRSRLINIEMQMN